MTFLLDAYNVIGQANHISLADANKIEVFIAWLKSYQKKGQHLTLVFDGQHEHVGFNRTERLPGMTIVHTAFSQTADDYIKEKINTSGTGGALTVVTSDREILHAAKKAKVKAMTSADFLNWFCQAPQEAEKKRSPAITDRHVNDWLAEFNQPPDQ